MRSDQARGSLATEQGEGVGGEFPPPMVGSFFIFRLENVQSGAYLRRKFRLDDYTISRGDARTFALGGGGGCRGQRYRQAPLCTDNVFLV